MVFVGVGDTIQPIIRPRMSGKDFKIYLEYRAWNLFSHYRTCKHCVWAWTWLYYILFGSQRPTERMYRDDIHVPRPGGLMPLVFGSTEKPSEEHSCSAPSVTWQSCLHHLQQKIKKGSNLVSSYQKLINCYTDHPMFLVNWAAHCELQETSHSVLCNHQIQSCMSKYKRESRFRRQ